MVIIKPLKALVCLAILTSLTLGADVWAYNGADISGGTGLQGEALSADPRVKSGPSQRSLTVPQPPRSSSTYGKSSSSRSHTTVSDLPRVSNPGDFYYSNPGPAVYPPQGYPPPLAGLDGYGQGPQNLLCPSGWNFSVPWYVPYLPRIGCKQFQISARLWYARLNSSTQIWGTNLIGGPGTELDLWKDLGLSKHQYIAEYEARCQFRPNWGLRFNFMPIAYRENYQQPYGFFFGNAFYPVYIAGPTGPFPIVSRWNRNIYRWDLVYDWYQARHAVSSIFAGYSLYDDKLEVGDFFQTRSRSRGFGLAFAGGSIDRVIRNLGCGGAAASVHCKASAQFLEGFFGWDGMATGRISVPMDCGRFGYVEAGWRWMVLERSYPTDTDKSSLDGLTGSVGLVF
jgi:hypothetical protein